MARLVGLIANRPDLGARMIEVEGRGLSFRRKAGVTPGWGVGFYQNGEILLKRRPIDDRPAIALGDVAGGIRTDLLIAHVRAATVGGLRTENTHPFRYRQWLFAHTGTIESFTSLRSRLRESLPAFLERDVRGETDSELLFHLFLSFLHDANVLDRQDVPLEAACSALRSTVALVDRLCAEEGAGPSAMNVLLSNAEYLVALHGGTPMAYRTYEGIGDLERLVGDGGLNRMRLPDFAQGRVTLVASDFDDDRPPAGWTVLPERAIVAFTRTDDPSSESL
jgi:glutamine amidotransferase